MIEHYAVTQASESAGLLRRVRINDGPWFVRVGEESDLALVTKQRDNLRGALAELLDYVQPLPGNYAVIDRARNALANLNKTDGE